MKKTEFYRKVIATRMGTREGLSKVWSHLTHVQHLNLLQDEHVASVLKMYGVVY